AVSDGFGACRPSADGERVDVLVLVEATSVTGCVMNVNTIGVLKMIDQGSEDEKILAIGLNNPVFEELKDYTELYPHLLREIEHFFTVYKELEAKTTRIQGWHDAAKAREIVAECQERYAKKK